MKIRGRPLAYEQAGTGIAYVVMENLALDQRLQRIVRYGGTMPLPIFVAASAEVDFLRTLWYSACNSTRRSVSMGTVSV